MSRTNRTETPSSPIQRYISFRGKEGVFSYWDKDSQNNIKFERVKVALIDIKHSISGYHEMSQGSISSNLVGDITDEILEVKIWNKGSSSTIAKGKYREIKEQCRGYGGKYTQNLICFGEINGSLEVFNVQLNGSSLGAWIDFRNQTTNDKIYDNWLILEKGSLCKREKGQNVPLSKDQVEQIFARMRSNPLENHPILFYNVKVSLGQTLEPQIATAADEADKQLRAYVEYYAKAKTAPQEESDPANDVFDDYSESNEIGHSYLEAKSGLTPEPISFNTQTPGDTTKQSEYAMLIQTDAVTMGWGIEELTMFIKEKYNVSNLNNLRLLPEATLVQIYNQIQNEEILRSYLDPAEVPF